MRAAASRRPSAPAGEEEVSNDDNERHGDGRAAKPKDDASERRATFARDIARSEFGRFYWNEGMEQAMRKALERRARPSAKKSK
jgi:hypothetical protein